MKSYALLILFILPGLFADGQGKTFKNRDKQSHGTADPRLNNVSIKPAISIMPSNAYPFSLIRTMAAPVISGKEEQVTHVIRSKGRPVFIERKSSESKAAPEERLYKFLNDTKELSGDGDFSETFKISKIKTDEQGITHIRTLQQYKGVDIYGSESTLHIDAVRERFTGSFHKPGPGTKTTPSVSAAAAVQKVVADVSRATVYKDLSPKEKDLLDYSSPECSLVLLSDGSDKYRLAWAVSIRPNFIEEWKYFIDAVNGELIRKYNNTNSDGGVTASATDLNGVVQTINTYLETGTYYLVDLAETMYVPSTGEGIIMTLDANYTSTSNLDYKYVTSSDNTWSQRNAVSAHNNATRTFRYFKETFGRNSLNDKGGNIISFINVTEDDGSSMENAFWNGKAVFYGNGGTYFTPLAGALDVAAHELGHGVVSNTANLEYYGQSGAMNESYADIFGAMVDRDDWLIGEDVTKTTLSPSGALRNMADPHNMGTSLSQSYWQPKTVTEMYLGSEDNGGVHINSGIGNYAYYLYATAVTKEKAERVFYRALDNYLTSTSQFIDWRIAVIQAASDLYGAASQEVVKAGEAFSAAGIQEEVQVEKTQDYTINSGQEYLLSYDTYESDAQTLYRSSVTGTELAPLSTREMMGKVSVTDDGTVAVFVSKDHFIRYMTLDPSNPQEYVLSTYGDWDNVAISKDGKRLAAISKFIDSTIYVFDLAGGGPPREFPLYNPTTSHSNTDAGGVLFADAIEFNITGEYLIYDACNILRSSTGDDIYYWDIGFMNVWDNSTGNFGDGTISKLFGSLPENVSVGNPVFSKNSPWIIAFDYIDDVNGVYDVYGADLNEGRAGRIAQNNTLGYPSFSKNDGKIALTRIYYDNSVPVECVATIGLASDKISPSGSITLVVDYARWPVFYATGSRDLILPPVADFTVDKKTGNAPLQVKFVDLSGNKPNSWLWTFDGATPASSTQQNPAVSYSVPGTYKVTLKATNTAGSNSITKEGYIIVATASGIDDEGAGSILIYPNPVSDHLNITCADDFSVILYDLNGRIVYSGTNDRLIDMSDIKPGIYVLELNTGNKLQKHKIVRE
jgi:Zn-dependent metalloprotease/PKD repeat protein